MTSPATDPSAPDRPTPDTLVLIDGHALAFRSYFALPPLSSSKGEATHAILGFLRFTLRLARQVMAAGGAAGAVLNAAKEQALDDFIAGRIRFTAMAAAVEHALDAAAGRAGFGDSLDGLEAVQHWDAAARRDAAAWQGAA